MGHREIPRSVEEVATDVVDAAYAVHRSLGPGLLESVYEACLCHELQKRDRRIQRQVPVPIAYDGLEFDQGFKADVIVDEIVICELKAVDQLHPRATAQLLTYLRLAGIRLGFLLNFGAPVMKDGIKRLVV